MQSWTSDFSGTTASNCSADRTNLETTMTCKARIALFRSSVLVPVLSRIGTWTLAAEELMLGTAIQESLCLSHRRQIGGGPALGYFQMEPSTHDDIWANYLNYRHTLSNNVASFLSSPTANKYLELENNDKYAAAMARVHYMRVSTPLPSQGNTASQANYWKQHYNTPLGKGKPQEYIDKWNKYVLGGTP